MCAPAIAIGLSAIGGLASAQGAEDAGKAKQSYYNYLASENEQQANEQLAQGDEQVTLTQDQAAADQRKLDRSVKQVEGAQRTAIAANGIAGSVTAQDIAKDTANKANLDAAALRYNADAKSWQVTASAKSSANALRQQASLNRYAGYDAALGADISAGSSLLSGATSVADKWSQWRQTGYGSN